MGALKGSSLHVRGSLSAGGHPAAWALSNMKHVVVIASCPESMQQPLAETERQAHSSDGALTCMIRLQPFLHC